ncbi:hypothetical protein FRC01_006117, partial [Tulasnella sp. 417]
MMGTFATQATKYFSVFGYESTGIFTVILSCIVLSIYGDWGTVVTLSWRVVSEPIIAQVIVFAAQLFFAYRCYTLYNRNKLILCGLIVGMLASVVMFTIVGVAMLRGLYIIHLNRLFTILGLCINI